MKEGKNGDDDALGERERGKVMKGVGCQKICCFEEARECKE